MQNLAHKTPFTAADYLAWEADQPERHDFVDGEVFAMSGGEDRNATVAGNVYIAQREHLRGTRCRVYLTDVKLHVRARDNYFYPDVMITCSDADRASRLSKSDPVLIIEVLSKSTEAYDRGEKFANYRAIETLAEYAMVDINSRRVDLYRKGADGLWVLHPIELTAPQASFTLNSIHLSTSADALFADIEGVDAAP
jgi:Uma2 family endonuclease